LTVNARTGSMAPDPANETVAPTVIDAALIPSR
jgi:hypothetical protein